MSLVIQISQISQLQCTISLISLGKIFWPRNFLSLDAESLWITNYPAGPLHMVPPDNVLSGGTPMTWSLRITNYLEGQSLRITNYLEGRSLRITTSILKNQLYQSSSRILVSFHKGPPPIRTHSTSSPINLILYLSVRPRVRHVL